REHGIRHFCRSQSSVIQNVVAIPECGTQGLDTYRAFPVHACEASRLRFNAVMEAGCQRYGQESGCIPGEQGAKQYHRSNRTQPCSAKAQLSFEDCAGYGLAVKHYKYEKLQGNCIYFVSMTPPGPTIEKSANHLYRNSEESITGEPAVIGIE